MTVNPEHVPSGRILFEKNEKFEILTLEELKLTNIPEADIQRSKTTPVAHHELIDHLMLLFTEAGLAPELDHIYVTKTGGTPLRNIGIQYGTPNILESWLLKKVTGKIKLPKFNTSETESCIAFAYHDKGIDVAFGQNVRDCSNMSIFGSNILHTYGKNQNVDYPKMLEFLRNWAKDIPTLQAKDLALIQSMKMISVTGKEMLQFMGKLIVLANASNMGKKVVAPLNVTAVSEVIRGILNDNEGTFIENNSMSLWKFYNYMTYVMKATGQDITNLMTEITALGNMIIWEFKVQPTIDVVDLTEDEDERQMSIEKHHTDMDTPPSIANPIEE